MDNNEGGSNSNNTGHNSNNSCSDNDSNNNISSNSNSNSNNINSNSNNSNNNNNNNNNNNSSNNNSNSNNSRHNNNSSNSSFEAAFFASSPFLVSLAAFVRQQLLVGRGDRDEAPPFASEGKPAALTSLSPEVLDRLLHVNREAAARTERQQPGKGLSSATAASTTSAVPGHGDVNDYEADFLEEQYIVREDGSVDWQRVEIAPNSEGDKATVAEGSRLAVLCHGALQRQRQQSPSQAQWMGGRLEKAVSGPDRLPFPGALVGMAKRIVRAPPPSSSTCASDEEEKEAAAEEVYVALCVCLVVLERALYDIHRGRNGKSGVSYDPTANVDVTGAATATADGGKGSAISDSDNPNGTAGGSGGGADENRGGEAVRPAMILRDLIATPEVKAALPEQMVAFLRLLLLPLGFNIRNLVWHGFLAPHELPPELASLVLTVTISISDATAHDTNSSEPGLPRAKSPIAGDACLSSEPEPPSTTSSDGGGASETTSSTVGAGASADLGRDSESPRVAVKRSENHGVNTDEQRSRNAVESLPPSPPHEKYPALPAWELRSFDDRLACPEALGSAVEFLRGEEQRRELGALVRRSAFVLPGREGMVLSAFRALAEGRQVLFLVEILPVLEHGLRCLFACANDSPAHLFAQLRQYYSTLDGFGQRARHQLLLDQEISGCPGRPNLLLAALGPGLSACLLDLFMMSAGPCLRGKVAHGELDMSSIFSTPSPESYSSSSSFSSSCSPFLSPLAGDSNDKDSCSGGGSGGGGDSHAAKAVPSTAGVVNLTAGVFFALCKRYSIPAGARAARRGGSDIINRNLKGVPHVDSGGDGGGGGDGGMFVEALASCDSHCSGWTPRFHPHELLEEDLRDSWTELGRLALALERRAISVEALPGVDLARMTVAISLCNDDDDNGDSNGDGDGDNDSSSGSDSKGRRGYAVHLPATGREPGEFARKRMEEARRGGGGGGGGGGSVVESKKEERPLSGAPATELVLTLTDTARRLIPPPAEAEDRRPLPVGTKGGQGSTKSRGSTAPNATSGVFPGVLRVNDALRHHVASLGGRSKRTAHHAGQGGKRPCHSSGAPLDRPPSGGCRRPGPAPGEGKLSAFAVYMHSELCRDSTTCDLDCLDRAARDALGHTLISASTGTNISTCASTSISTCTSTSVGTSTSSPLTFKASSSAEPRVDGTTTSDKYRDRGEPGPRTDEGGNGTDNSDGTNGFVSPDTGRPRESQRDARRGLCREGEDAGFGLEQADKGNGSFGDEDGNTYPRPEPNSSPASAPTPAASTTNPPMPAPTPTPVPAPASTPPPQTTRRFRRNREPGRISPPTNVVTAAPLPQISCMSGLCRSCADVARGLRAHIGELEALLASGAARSGQRRAYAATLHVAPTLLRYLAAAAAAVEVFVVDWDARHNERALAAGVIGSGGRCPESPSPPQQPPLLDGARGSDSGATGLGQRRSRVPVSSRATAAAAGTKTANSSALTGSAEAVGSAAEALAAAEAVAPPDIAASLGFLRRLAAVNGSLALCVAAGTGGDRSATVGVGIKTGSGGVEGGRGGAGSATARVEKSGGGGRKGYAQALAELASFLESKAARRGFAGF